METSNFGQFTKYSINTVITQFFLLIPTTAASIITARVLGPEGKGQLTLILLFPILAVTFGRMGMGHAINYYASKISPTRLILNSFVLSAFLGVLLIVITLPLIHFLKNSFFEEISEKTLIFICFLIPFSLLHMHLNAVMQGYYKINYYNFLIIGKPIIYLSTLVVLIIILKLGLFGAIISWAISLLAAFFLSVFFILKEFKLEEIKLDFRFMKQLLTFGTKSHIGNIFKDLTYRADILIVSFFLSSAFVGYYTVAVILAEIAWRIPNAIGTVLLSRIAHLDKAQARFFTPLVCRRILLPAMAVCLIIFVLSENLITFAFGKEFQLSSSALVLLLPGIFAFTIWKVLATDIIAQGHPTAYSFTAALGFCTMIVMDLLLIPRLGINGAAIGSSISYIASTIFVIYIYIKITKNSLKSLLIPLKSDFIFYKNFIINIISLRPIVNRYTNK